MVPVKANPPPVALTVLVDESYMPDSDVELPPVM